MRNSKLKIIFKVIAFVLMLSMITSGLALLVVNRSTSLNVPGMREFYGQEQIDLVFLGSSSVYRACNPLIADEILEMNTFNLGTSSQNLRDSYYLLREAFRLYQPRYVVMNLSHERLTAGPDRNDKSANLIFDYMHWSGNKLSYLFSAFTLDEFQSALFQAYRGRESLPKMKLVDYLLANIDYYSSEHPQRTLAEMDAISDGYFVKGYVRSDKTFKDGVMPRPSKVVFDGPQSVTSEALLYLDKIRELCDKESAELIIFLPPQLPANMERFSDYGAFNSFVRDYCSDYALTYWNFNLVRPEILPVEDNMFYDFQHMNNSLASDFSELLSKLLLQHIRGNQVDETVFFYASYVEYRETINRVLACWIDNLDNGIVTANSFSGRMKVEYRFSIIAEDGTVTVFRDYAETSTAELPHLASGEYKIQVEARVQGSDKEYEQRNIAPLKIT